MSAFQVMSHLMTAFTLFLALVLTSSTGVTASSSYDFIVVGGGTSGLTVADRLTEDSSISVLVVEYGVFDHHEASVLVPGLLNLTSSPYPFNITSVPQKELNNRTFDVPAAAVVGGSSVINGMFFDRGGAADYDAWEQLGNTGWNWNNLLPYFEKSENFSKPASSFAAEFDISWDASIEGKGGPVQSSYPDFQFPSINNFISAWHSLGITTPKDPSAGVKAGVFWAPSSLNAQNESRSYSRVAHYDRVIHSRPNYHVIDNTAVMRILIREGVAVGVETVDRASGNSSTYMAKSEVILAAGAVHSPQILQLSGVGPKSLVNSLGIEPIMNLPGVGQNFQDHPTVYLTFNYTNPSTPNADTLLSNQSYAAEQLALYYSSRQGAYTITAFSGNVVAFLPLRNVTSNYQQLIQEAGAFEARSIYPNRDPAVLSGYEAQRKIILNLYASTNTSVQETGFSSGSVVPVTLVKPLSRGTVKAITNSTLHRPSVDWASLTAPSDISILAAAILANRQAFKAHGLDSLAPVELSPGANVTTRQELEDALHSIAQPTYSHPCCSCAMMPLAMGGVVAPDLLVHGVRNLSIVDASIMPMIPATHLSATVYALAERAADIIKARHGIQT